MPANLHHNFFGRTYGMAQPNPDTIAISGVFVRQLSVASRCICE